MVPTNAKGVKLICRTSNEYRAAVLGSPFDYPLSSRLDENDAIFVLDNVFVPWEDVFVYGDVEKANNFFPRTGFLPRALIHGCTRLAVKLDFITGLLIKATEITGARAFRGVEANIGEVIAWRNMIWGLSDAMAKTADPWRIEFPAYSIISSVQFDRWSQIARSSRGQRVTVGVATEPILC